MRPTRDRLRTVDALAAAGLVRRIITRARSRPAGSAAKFANAGVNALP